MKLFSKKRPEIKIKVNAYIIAWFSISNKWVKFEKPIWYLFKRTGKEYKPSLLTKKLQRRFSYTEDQSSQVFEYLRKLRIELEEPFIQVKQDIQPLQFLSNPNYLPYSKYTYRLNDYSFTISYDSRDAEYYIHPLFRSFVFESEEERKVDFVVASHDDRHVLESSIDQHSIMFSTMSGLKKHLLKVLTGQFYHISSQEWISTIHAAAISNGEHSILFSSPSGSGKSTMAFLLLLRAYRLVADDFVAIHGKQGKVYSFPTAVSIKKEGLDFINSQLNISSSFECSMQSFGNGASHYLYPDRLDTYSYAPSIVKTIVFLRYDPDADCILRKLELDEAIQLFYHQAWTCPKYKSAKAFIHWFRKVNCYNLVYGNSEKALQKIDSLFLEKHID